MRQILVAWWWVLGCDGTSRSQLDLHAFADACVTVQVGGQSLEATPDGAGFRFARTGQPSRFALKAADLGVFLLHDTGGGYLVAEEDGALQRHETLESDVTRVDDAFVSGAEWVFDDTRGLRLQNRRTGGWLDRSGLTTGGARVRLEPADGCVAPPELSLDAEGTVLRTTFEDGDLFGIADTHAHLMSNWGFGGGGIYHGAPFHRLGVEHALGDCAVSHGPAGRKDFIGYAFDRGGADGLDLTTVLGGLIAGEIPEDNHATDGFPTFTDWPDAVRSSTHQTEYHRWIERAYLAGLRLIVQHATSNAVLCELSVGAGDLPQRYPCDDMTAVDRSIDETYALERYLDAQAGGPGQGWFRVVHSPREARDVIASGKLAVILGIEVSDLFGCRLTPRPGDPDCNEAWISSQLDVYADRGVRVVFPVHKYDNQFSAGDGDRAFIELGNFLSSGHWSNFVPDDCPDVPTVFDEGPVVFAGLNEPRAQYFSPPPHDFAAFGDDIVGTVLPFLGRLSEPPLEGDHCQNAGLTDRGRFLVDELMRRGMLVEIDHLPRRAYVEVFERLSAQDYPALGTHGNTFDGRIYEHGGLSKASIGRCRAAGQPGRLLNSLRSRVNRIRAAGGYPAEGLGFDLNGLAGARGGRFEPGACEDPQVDPTTYPFQSWAGDVTFTEPWVGVRRIDFDTEGFVHVGMLPELLDDARRDASSDAELEPLFRSAEAYVRMWETAEARAAALREE